MKHSLNIRTKILPTVACLTVLAGAIAAANAAPERATANPLRVGLFPAANSAVEVRVTNTSNKAARVPKWQLPQDVLQADLFRVSRDGQPIEYVGALVKRGVPEASDFAVLRPGETRSTLVDLAATYDMSQPGEYTVALASPLQDASLSGGKPLKTARGMPMVLESPALRLWNDGGVKPFVQKLDANIRGKGKPGGGGSTTAVSNGISFVGCSATQTSTITSAVSAARTYSENAKGYLNAGTTGSRYTTWFGAYTSSRYATARDNFVAIDTAMDQSAGQIKINCGCKTKSFAYVYANRPYEIFVCNAFWSASLTGTDSKAGTLIHEMSHFDAVTGTQDHAYSQANAKQLAISSPSLALDNADNHEYFAENTPSLN